MKSERQKKIIEIICSNEIDTQEELVEILRNTGYDVTQATISRDIRALGLIKVAGDTKRQKYAIPDKIDPINDGKYLTILRDAILSLDSAENIIVIKTVSGMAMAVAAGIDNLNIDTIVGCVAGDDTLMCVVRSKNLISETIEQFKGIHRLAKENTTW